MALYDGAPDIILAKVDMTKEQNLNLRARFGIRGYPAMKIFKGNSELPYEFRGPRNTEGIYKYLVVERERTRECGPPPEPRDPTKESAEL